MSHDFFQHDDLIYKMREGNACLAGTLQFAYKLPIIKYVVIVFFIHGERNFSYMPDNFNEIKYLIDKSTRVVRPKSSWGKDL